MTVLNPDTSGNKVAMEENQNTSGNVKVIVRVRPPNNLETNGQRKTVVEVMNENILVFDPKEESSPFHGRHGRRRPRDIRKRRQKDLKFAFDYVFGWSSSNFEVFEHTTQTVLEGLLSGYNCSVFAYGATGAGKTHTMLGSESHPGVIYHTMIHLYQHIADLSQEKTCDVAVSYLEVYNEQIRDLLMPRGTLPIREDHSSGVIIPGLSLHKPRTAEELLHMLQFGNQNRTQHPTDANAESSRSHAVFQVFVRQRERTANISAQVKVAKMCLVDLAGSERATVTKNRGARLREGANINRSLLALGNVINSLADHKYKGHIPYRDSKLTRLLKDSLGGNCRTIMIAAISPSEISYEDTYNTLKYADRAKNIRLDMKKNVVNVDFHVSRYGKIVEELRREITELKTKLQHCERPTVNHTLAVCLPANLQSLRESLQAAYNERRALRDRQLRQETGMRDTQWRLYRKHKCLRRALLMNNTLPETTSKVQGVIDNLQRKVEREEGERLRLCQLLQINNQTLHTLHSQADTADNKASLYSQVLELSVKQQAMEVELNDSRHYIHHLRRLARAQEQEAVASETLITALLKLVQQQHTELQRQHAVSPDIAAAYQGVCEVVGQWGVSWADEEGDGDHPFHINTIIDIPLVTSSGVVLHKVPSPGHPSTASPYSGSQTRTNPTTGCPGRVVNGQVVFSATPSSAPSTHIPTFASATPSLPSAHYTPSTPHPTTPRLDEPSCHSTHPPSLEKSVTNVSLGVSFDGSDHTGNNFRSNIHAGHTPNPKKLPQQVDNDFPSGSVLSDSTAKPSPDHKLNETFSLEDSGQRCETVSSVNTEVPATRSEMCYVDDSMRQGSVDSTLVLNGPSLACVPVVDSSHSSCAATSMPGRDSAGVAHTDNHTVQTHSYQQSHIASKQGFVSQKLQDTTRINQNAFNAHNSQIACGVKNSTHNGQNACEAVLNPTHNSKNAQVCVKDSENAHCVTRPHKDSSVCGVKRSGETSVNGWDKNAEMCGQDENDDPQFKPHFSVRRAINFDGVECHATPARVECKSYADAVRTPTPPRQPLQSLDCNSPQLHASNVPSDVHQTPKSSGRGSMYVAGPQAMDNIRRLKQMGLPSLVENLVMAPKNTETSKPSYMQPTKATALRVRIQTTSRDDSFNPKRVQRKTLAHSRSKSTSQLNRIGWKI